MCVHTMRIRNEDEQREKYQFGLEMIEFTALEN